KNTRQLLSIARFQKMRNELRLLKQSSLFDNDWYLNKYEDVAKSKIDPAKHYLRWGAQEGRDPSPSLNTNSYINANPDVGSSGINPLLHYLRYGLQERRPLTSVLAADKVSPAPLLTSASKPTTPRIGEGHTIVPGTI